MYYTIADVTPDQVRLNLASKYMNLGKHVFAFVFDNSKGAVKLIKDKSEETIAWIRYEDIDHFNIVARSVGSKGNHVYEVIMYLKSYASWPLFQFGAQSNADAELAKLKAAIDLTKKSSFIDKPKFPSELIAVTHENGKTVLRWRNSAKVSDAVQLGVIGLAVGALILFLLKFTFSQSIFGSLVIVVFFIIYLFVMYGKVTTLMKDHITEYGFAFDSNELVYFEDSISSKQRKLTSTIPKNIWAGVSYPHSASGPDVILSANLDTQKKYEELIANKASIKELYNAKKDTLSNQHLRIKDLHPVELVNTVNWIMAEIDKNSGR